MTYRKTAQHCESYLCFLQRWVVRVEGGTSERRGHVQVTKQQMTGNPVWGTWDVRQKAYSASLKFSQIYLPA